MTDIQRALAIIEALPDDADEALAFLNRMYAICIRSMNVSDDLAIERLKLTMAKEPA